MVVPPSRERGAADGPLVGLCGDSIEVKALAARLAERGAVVLRSEADLSSAQILVCDLASKPALNSAQAVLARADAARLPLVTLGSPGGSLSVAMAQLVHGAVLGFRRPLDVQRVANEILTRVAQPPASAPPMAPALTGLNSLPPLRPLVGRAPSMPPSMTTTTTLARHSTLPPAGEPLPAPPADSSVAEPSVVSPELELLLADAQRRVEAQMATPEHGSEPPASLDDRDARLTEDVWQALAEPLDDDVDGHAGDFESESVVGGSLAISSVEQPSPPESTLPPVAQEEREEDTGSAVAPLGGPTVAASRLSRLDFEPAAPLSHALSSRVEPAEPDAAPPTVRPGPSLTPRAPSAEPRAYQPDTRHSSLLIDAREAPTPVPRAVAQSRAPGPPRPHDSSEPPAREPTPRPTPPPTGPPDEGPRSAATSADLERPPPGADEPPPGSEHPAPPAAQSPSTAAPSSPLGAAPTPTPASVPAHGAESAPASSRAPPGPSRTSAPAPQTRRQPASDASPPTPAAAGLKLPKVLVRGAAASVLGQAIRQRFSGCLAFEVVQGLRRVIFREGDLVLAASAVHGESLVAFLTHRGDIAPETAQQIEHRIPMLGRHAGAALIARGLVEQAELWSVLRSHSEWIMVRLLELDRGTVSIEEPIPERLAAEPAVFGGATGAEVLVDVVQRAVGPSQAHALLGRGTLRLLPSASASLLSECALSPRQLELVRRAEECPLDELLSRSGDEPMLASILFALTLLDIRRVERPSKANAARPEQVPRTGPDDLDDEALRTRIRLRRALVDEGDYFALLGVAHQATGYDIRRSYLELRRQFSPRQVLRPSTVDLQEDIDTILEVLEEAYDILRDERRRERYRRAIESIPSG